MGHSAKRNTETKRVSSITRKLLWQLAGSKLRLILQGDLLLFLVLSCGWAYLQEIKELGNFEWNRHRSLSMKSGLSSLTYKIIEDDIEIVRVNASKACCAILGILVVLLILQLIFHIFLGTYSMNRTIQKILSPINEIALRADALSRMTYNDGSKFAELEDAIDRIRPEDEMLLSLNDSDLAGIEAAMNNLLIRMRETNRQQARFVNDASHELRTPIAVIQGYANMLERWGSEDKQVLEESIHAISNEAEHMNKLVEQLLFLARGDSGRTKLKLEQIELNDMMQEIYEESFMIDEKHLYRLRNADELEPIVVNADLTLLKQAVRILIDNAAKYTKEGDEIILGIGRTKNKKPYIQVQDTGIGMAESDVVHMFDRFYRSDEVRGYSGTGLGLSIAKWIVDMHGGHFEILSRTELGTRIRIVL